MSRFRAAPFVTFFLLGCDCGDDPASSSFDAGGDEDGGTPFDAGPPPACPDGPETADVSASLSDGEVRVGRVTDPSSLLGGGSAEGEIGDLKIYNAHVAFIVEAAGDSENYVPYGGALVDADLVRAPGESGGDVIDEFAATPGIAAFSADCVGVVTDGSTGEAVVRAVGTDARIPIIEGVGRDLVDTSPKGLWVVNEYRLGPDDTSLEVTTTVTNPTERTLSFDVGDFALFSDDGVDPFDSTAGFARATTQADILGVAGEASHFALGVFSDGEALDGDYLGIGGLIAGGPGGDVAIFIYSQDRIQFGPLDSASWTRYVALGRDVDDLVRERHRRVPASAKDLVTVSGVVHEIGTGVPVEGARVHLTKSDAYASMSLTDATGRYEMVVPAGSYELVATGATIGQDVIVPNRPAPSPPFAAGREKGPIVAIDAQADVVQDLEIGGAVAIDLTITDADDVPIAGKVIFRFPGGVDPTPPDPFVGERNPYDDAANVFWTSDGRITGFVAPGSYQVVAASGFDYELDTRDVTLDAGETMTETFVLDRAFTRDGYVSLDAHLHAGPSIHGEITLEERLVTNMAEGLEAMCASDHDRVVDYGPALASTGLDHVVLPSEEISTFLNGHFNPYPIALRSELADNGPIQWWDLTVQEMFDQAIEDQGAIVLQINHGAGGLGGYFSAAEYDPATGEVGAPENWSDRFNAMEILNGRGGWEPLEEIFFGLVNHGKRVGITGVSDSHHRIPEAGSGRTYVRLPDGAAVTPDTIATAIVNQHTVVSGGAMITLTTAGGAAAEGDTFVMNAAGDVDLAIRVESASWAPVEEVTIFGEGVALETIAVDGSAPVWLDTTRTYAVDRNTWFAARATGSSDMAPAYPGAQAFALTTPVYVEINPDL